MAGQPRPPAPTTTTAALCSLSCPRLFQYTACVLSCHVDYLVDRYHQELVAGHSGGSLAVVIASCVLLDDNE